jgi:hypothetical protein
MKRKMMRSLLKLARSLARVPGRVHTFRETCELICRAEYAYGAVGRPPDVPPGTSIRYEVELISMVLPKKDRSEYTAAEKIALAQALKAKGTRELVRADLFLDWRDRRAGGDAEQALHGHLAWTAAEWLSVHTLLRQPTDGGDGALAGWAEIRSGDLWQATLGYTELGEPEAVRQTFLSWTMRLNSAFRLRLGHVYDLAGGQTLESTAVLVQRIGDSWELEYGLNERTSRYDDGSLGFTVRVRLFKF